MFLAAYASLAPQGLGNDNEISKFQLRENCHFFLNLAPMPAYTNPMNLPLID